MKKSLEYWNGVVETVIEMAIENDIYMDEDKQFEYLVKPYSDDSFKVRMNWIVAFEETKYKATRECPEDDPEPVCDFQEIYFRYDEKLWKVIKDVTVELESISNRVIETA